MFSEPMNMNVTGVEVTGPGEIAVKTRDPMLMARDRLFMVTLDGTLAPGLYSIPSLGAPFPPTDVRETANILLCPSRKPARRARRASTLLQLEAENDSDR